MPNIRIIRDHPTRPEPSRFNMLLTLPKLDVNSSMARRGVQLFVMRFGAAGAYVKPRPRLTGESREISSPENSTSSIPSS